MTVSELSPYDMSRLNCFFRTRRGRSVIVYHDDCKNEFDPSFLLSRRSWKDSARPTDGRIKFDWWREWIREVFPSLIMFSIISATLLSAEATLRQSIHCVSHRALDLLDPGNQNNLAGRHGMIRHHDWIISSSHPVISRVNRSMYLVIPRIDS